MKKNALKTIALLLMGAIMLTACAPNAAAQNSDEAKTVLRQAREKCQSIEGGHYVMQMKKKYMSGNDTITTRYTCDFKKKFSDRIFGKVFAQLEEYGDGSQHYLYTGNEFVYYDDTVGTVMKRKQWADENKSIRHNYQFYTPLTSANCYPLPSRKDLKDTSYTYFLSETWLDGKPCYLASYYQDYFPPREYGPQVIFYEVKLWIDKRDFIPIQYSIVYDIVEQQDTMRQYDECRLLEFSTEVDKSKLTLASVPATVKMEDYEPDQEPEPLAEGTPAPNWSLPSLTGDTVRLADLRGKVVLVDFFYKSCAPCCAAMPFLQQLHEKYKDQGFVMIGIDPYDDPMKDEMADFLAKRGVTYTVLFSDRELSEAYHVNLYPTLFFIDREGKIAKVRPGYHPTLEEAIEEQLQKML